MEHRLAHWIFVTLRSFITELFRKALDQQVTIMPWPPFHINGGGQRGVRLDISNFDQELIGRGMYCIAEITNTFMCDLGRSSDA